MSSVSHVAWYGLVVIVVNKVPSTYTSIFSIPLLSSAVMRIETSPHTSSPSVRSVKDTWGASVSSSSSSQDERDNIAHKTKAVILPYFNWFSQLVGVINFILRVLANFKI